MLRFSHDPINPPRTLLKSLARTYGYWYNKKDWAAKKKARKVALKSKKRHR